MLGQCGLFGGFRGTAELVQDRGAQLVGRAEVGKNVGRDAAVLQRFGVQTDRFGSGTGTITGLA